MTVILGEKKQTPSDKQGEHAKEHREKNNLRLCLRDYGFFFVLIF